MKKFLLFLFVFATFNVANAEKMLVNGIYYNTVDEANFTCEVTYGDYYGYYSGGIVIPETIEDYGTPYTVVGIGYDAFYDCYDLLNIILPETITYIDSYAFYYCSNLTSISLPQNLTAIYNYAFYGCSTLTEITIPENVTYIGDNAFNYCNNLKTLNFNATRCTSCYANSFPSSLTNVNLGDNVKVIPPYFYYKKTALTSVYIPNNVTEIGRYAYYGCTGLTSLNLGSGVKTINEYAFYGCENLTEITIPQSVTSLAAYSFGGCNFVTLNFNATSCEVSGWDSPFYNSTKINTVNFGSKVTKIPNYFLMYATRIRELTFPTSLTTIGYDAFYGCTGLSEIVIPDKVTTIGDYAFYSCSNITTATIGEAVTEIDYGAFYNTNIEILNFNTKNCTSSMNNSQFPSTITKVNIGEKVKTIPAYFCYDCSGLTEVVIPDRVTTIGQYAFQQCTNLENLTFGYGLTTIGNYAFGSCSSLKTITSYNTTPPTFGTEPYVSYISGINAIVDKNAVSAYKSANIWSNFTYSKTDADFTAHNLRAKAMNAAYDTEDALENVWTRISNSNFTSDSEEEYNDILKDILAIEKAIDEAYQNNTISEQVVAEFLESLEALNEEISEFTEDEIDEALEKCGELLVEIANLLTKVDDNSSYATRYYNLEYMLETYTGCRNAGTAGGSYFFNEVYALLDDIQALRSDIRSYLGYDAIILITIDPVEKVEIARYNLQGQRISEPQRGINIIQYSDGSTQKVLIK